MSERRWVGPTLLLLAVFLMGTGIAGMLRVAYIQRPSWILVILPIGEVLIGCLLLLIPLLRRLSREADEQDEADRRTAEGNRPRPGSGL